MEWDLSHKVRGDGCICDGTASLVKHCVLPVPGPPHVGFWKFFFLLHFANFLQFLWLDNDTCLWVEPASLDFIWGLHPGGGVGSWNATLPLTVLSLWSLVSLRVRVRVSWLHFSVHRTRVRVRGHSRPVLRYSLWWLCLVFLFIFRISNQVQDLVDQMSSDLCILCHPRMSWPSVLWLTCIAALSLERETCRHMDGLPSHNICHVFVRKVFLCLYWQ